MLQLRLCPGGNSCPSIRGLCYRHRVPNAQIPPEIYTALQRWQCQSQDIIGVWLVAARGSSPMPLGLSMIINEADEIAGAVSGGCVDAEVLYAARAARDTGTAQP